MSSNFSTYLCLNIYHNDLIVILILNIVKNNSKIETIKDALQFPPSDGDTTATNKFEDLLQNIKVNCKDG